MKRLSKDTVHNAQVLLRSGKSVRATSKTLGISVGAVLNIRKDDLNNIPILKAGRPYKVSKRTTRHIARDYDIGRISTLRQGKRLNKAIEGFDIHRSTVDKYLKMEGLKTYVQQKKRGLTKDQKAARLKFARDHLHWTVDDWKQVMFSDETIFSRIGPYGKKFYHKRPEKQRLGPNPEQEIKQGGGGKLMIWGCITYFGIGDSCSLPQGLDSETYVDVLQDYIIQSRDYYNMDSKKFMFQHDNCKVHTANIVKNFFRKSKINVMEWPVNSPDLSPIENVWSYCKYHLDQYENDPDDLDDLWERVQDIWNMIPVEYLRSLYESMPKRMQSLYRNRGGHITY